MQTRLLQIGLSLIAVVMLGGGAGIVAIATQPSSALVISACIVAGCVVAVLVALLSALSAVRAMRARAATAAATTGPLPVLGYAQYPAPAPSEQVVAHAPQPAPLWPHSDEHSSGLSDDLGQRREVFVKLARRLQSLINRSIQRIDQLEQENEDPILLNGLYEIDHLFTLARRQGENLAVLGGEPPQRRSNRPVSVYAVLLAAVSEAEHYRQIAIVPVDDLEIHGHAVAEIIHLLAELLENATRFTSPDGPKVEVRAHKVTAGLAIEVQDRGLGMGYEELERINHLLDGSTRMDIGELLQDGRIGLAVVRELARRHGIRVRLQSNIFGGIAAAVVIPSHLLSEPPPTPSRRRAAPSPVPRERQTEQPGILAAPEPARPVAVAAIPKAVGSSSGQHHLPDEPAEDTAERDTSGERPAERTIAVSGGLPDLPVRDPGRSYADLRAGEQAGGRRPPPLPQRSGSHLREELLEPPAPATQTAGHNTRLMATVQEGRDHWLTEQARDAEPTEPNQGPTGGESAAWPTT